VSEKEPRIYRPSFSSLWLDLGNAGQHLAPATAFIVVREDRAFLITNWQVLSGSNPWQEPAIDAVFACEWNGSAWPVLPAAG